MLRYLNRHPTAAEILAAVYEVKTPALFTDIDENQFKSGFGEFQQVLGQAPEGAPDDFRDNVRFATEMMEKMKNKVN